MPASAKERATGVWLVGSAYQSMTVDMAAAKRK
jgi:hypothetical protein